VQPMDLRMEMEMNQEFDVLLPRAGETNFQVRLLGVLFWILRILGLVVEDVGCWRIVRREC
jgi:hypothetical protein